MNNELEKVRENLATWLVAFNNKDLETLISVYDPEIVYANSTSPLMKGLDEVKQWYVEAFKQFDSELLYKEETAFIEGNIALLSGKFCFKQCADSTQSNEALTGRVGLMYRKTKDGRWLLLFDMDNTPPDVLASDF